MGELAQAMVEGGGGCAGCPGGFWGCWGWGSRRVSRNELLRRKLSLRELSRESNPRRGELVASRHSDDDLFVFVPEYNYIIIEFKNKAK